ncbi:unnamed protein product [Arabidopsis halleri]
MHVAYWKAKDSDRSNLETKSTDVKQKVPSLVYTRPHHSQLQRSSAIHL